MPWSHLQSLSYNWLGCYLGMNRFKKNGLESHGSPSVVSGVAVLTSPGHLLDKQILRPYHRPTESETGAGAQESESSQNLQVGQLELKFENH